MTAAVADLDTPAVVAGKVARIQAQIDRWALVAILLGLAFTMVNVQTFAAAGAAVWTLPWLAAWLLDPMVSILLLVVVRAEQVTARWQVRMAWQVTATKWAAFAATYVMNTWSSIAQGVWSDIVLHSVPPVFVLIGAEVLPKLREGLTEAVLKARTYASTVAAATTGRPHDPPPLPPAPDLPVTTGPTPAAGAVREGDPAGGPGAPDGETAQGHAVGGVTEHDEPNAAGYSSGPDRAVRASITDATDRLLRHAPGPEHRPGSQGESAATLDRDDADLGAGQGSFAALPDAVVPPAAEASSEPAPGAARDHASGEHGPPPPEQEQDAAPSESEPVTGDDLEPRVLLLVEQLRRDPDLTGPEAVAALEAAGFGPVAARTARRLLSKARDALAPSLRDSAAAAPDEPGTSVAAADDAADGADGAPDNDLPGGQTPRPRVPTGTNAGRSLALVRPAATSPGDR